jgi:3-oxoacyl-[acyl-carrier-protein] synthase-1
MFISATSMVCPVGLSAATACAAKRAGISAFKALPYNDNTGEPIVGAVVPGFKLTMRQAPRLIGLLTQALAQLVKGRPAEQWEQVPLLVGLAEPGRPGGGADLAGSIVRRLQEGLGVRFHAQHSRAIASGHSAGFEALRVARGLLGAGSLSTCVVCGVDSLVNAVTLLWLEHHGRLKTPANRDGVIPGEAAAAVVLRREAQPGLVTEIVGLGFSKEKAHILSEEPLVGVGMTEATRQALAEARLGFHEIDGRLSDVTGELYGFKELPLAEARLMRVVRKQEQPLWHWAEAVGDSGAAAGVMQLVLADEAFRKGYAPGERMLCLASAVAGDRAAVVLRRRPR